MHVADLHSVRLCSSSCTTLSLAAKGRMMVVDDSLSMIYCTSTRTVGALTLAIYGSQLNSRRSVKSKVEVCAPPPSGSCARTRNTVMMNALRAI